MWNYLNNLKIVNYLSDSIISILDPDSILYLDQFEVLSYVHQTMAQNDKKINQ